MQLWPLYFVKRVAAALIVDGLNDREETRCALITLSRTSHFKA
jgi:hypothetical protein